MSYISVTPRVSHAERGVFAQRLCNIAATQGLGLVHEHGYAKLVAAGSREPLLTLGSGTLAPLQALVMEVEHSLDEGKVTPSLAEQLDELFARPVRALAL